VALAAGAHTIESLAVDVPVAVDRIVLSDVADSHRAVTEGPTATVVDDGRFRRTIQVDHCPDGCWLVLGEGFSGAWTASGPGGSLGEPQPVDGGFNGWRIAPTTQPVEIVVEWTQQRNLEIAFAVTVIGVIVALALFVLDRRRRRAGAGGIPAGAPVLRGDLVAVTRRRAIVLALVWCVASGVLIAPEWALAGAAGGLAVIVLRRQRLVELTAWATVVAVGALVTIRERRNSPAPDGGWPTIFESWHRLAMFAVVTVLVAALFADDPTPDRNATV
jgi:arabinofuranan 3-O-arabinosyltransferase